MLDFADIFLKIMYEKIIETTMLKLLIGTTAESRTDCCSKRKADIGEFILAFIYSRRFSFCKNKQPSNYKQRLCGLLFRNLIKFLLCFQGVFSVFDYNKILCHKFVKKLLRFFMTYSEKFGNFF